MEIQVNINAKEISTAISELAEAIKLLATATETRNTLCAEYNSILKTGVTKEKTKSIESEEGNLSKKEVQKTENPNPEPTQAENTITLEEVRAKLAALSKSGKQAQVKDLITKFGAKKLTDIPQEKYAELLKEAEGIS